MSIKLHVTEVELCKYDIKSALDTIAVVLCFRQKLRQKKIRREKELQQMAETAHLEGCAVPRPLACALINESAPIWHR